MRRIEPLGLLVLHGHRLRIHIEFDSDKASKTQRRLGIHRVRRHILADGDAILLS